MITEVEITEMALVSIFFRPVRRHTGQSQLSPTSEKKPLPTSVKKLKEAEKNRISLNLSTVHGNLKQIPKTKVTAVHTGLNAKSCMCLNNG